MIYHRTIFVELKTVFIKNNLYNESRSYLRNDGWIFLYQRRFFYGENNMEHHLSYEEQLLLFKERGMQGIEPDTADFEKQLNTLKIIGYYKLKQYSYTFWNRKSLKYEEIQFNNLVKDIIGINN